MNPQTESLTDRTSLDLVVPRVNLADPESEPSDSDLEALTASMMIGVRMRQAQAHARFLSQLESDTVIASAHAMAPIERTRGG